MQSTILEKELRTFLESRIFVLTMTLASADQIAAHYNEIALARHGRHRRSENDCVHLRRLNNWVKTIQILDFIESGDCIFDFCSGKGGDLGKYAKRNIGYYVGCDISLESVKESVQRYNSFRPKFGAMLLSGDGFCVNLDNALPKEIQFNAVSCQFSLHYAFECEERVRRALDNISCRLLPGGHFFGTLPDANVIVNRMRAERALNSDARSFGNGFYKVTIEDPESFDRGRILKSSPFCHRYMFDLNDAVNSCWEWLVPKSTLVKIAKDFGLELVYWMNLHQFFVQNSANAESVTLLSQMNVADSNGNIPLKEFEIAGIYVAFAFRKSGAKDTDIAKYRKPFRTFAVDDIIHV